MDQNYVCQPGKALIYKLYASTISVECVEWRADSISDSFKIRFGVKQVFLSLDDFRYELGGGLIIDGINIRIRLYADDIKYNTCI